MGRERTRQELARENSLLRQRLAEAEETLDAIRGGHVDAVVAAGPDGEQVFTLRGADYIYRILIETMNEGAAILSEGMCVTYCNKRFARILGIPMEKITGTQVSGLVCESHRAAFGSILSGENGARGEVCFMKANGCVPLMVSASRLDSGVSGHCIVCTDLTELKDAQSRLQKLNSELEERVAMRTSALQASKEEKEILLREIHHRVKNNLQLISSLLSLQARSSGDAKAALALDDSRNRINSIALVHKSIYGTKSISSMGSQKYLKSLAENMAGSAGEGVKITVDADDMPLAMDSAIKFGLITNELLCNSLKHAFPDRKGNVSILLRGAKDDVVLVVKDDGRGIPGDVDWENSKSMGFTIVALLTKQLGGRIERVPGRGTEFRVTIPKKVLQ